MRTNRQTDRRTDGHDEANSSFSKFGERPQTKKNHIRELKNRHGNTCTVRGRKNCGENRDFNFIFLPVSDKAPDI